MTHHLALLARLIYMHARCRVSRHAVYAGQVAPPWHAVYAGQVAPPWHAVYAGQVEAGESNQSCKAK